MSTFRDGSSSGAGQIWTQQVIRRIDPTVAKRRDVFHNENEAQTRTDSFRRWRVEGSLTFFHIERLRHNTPRSFTPRAYN